MELEEFKKKLDAIDENAIDEFMENLLLKVGIKALADVKENSKVISGLMKNSWRLGSVKKVGISFEIELTNSVKYGKWAEYGHWSKKNKDGKRKWIEGNFRVTTTMEALEKEFKSMLIVEQKKFLLKKLKGK